MNISNIALDALVEKIISAFDKKAKKIPCDKTFPSVIYGKNEDGTYVIIKDMYKYNVPNGLGFDLKVSQGVWVTVPGNSFKDMYISAIREKRK